MFVALNGHPVLNLLIHNELGRIICEIAVLVFAFLVERYLYNILRGKRKYTLFQCPYFHCPCLKVCMIYFYSMYETLD